MKQLKILLMILFFVISLLAGVNTDYAIAYWIYSIVCVFVVLTAFIGKISWFHVFLAVFFFMGTWLKTSMHHIFEYPYVEPIGRFSGSAVEWYDYYATACVIGIGIVLAKFTSVIMAISKKTDICMKDEGVGGSIKNIEWMVLVLLAAMFYVMNNYFSFFVTGVQASVELPFGLNAPVGFMALIGVPLIAATFLNKDIMHRGYLSKRAMIIILLISLMASISMVSRAAIVMQAVPVLISATYLQAKTKNIKISIKPFVVFFVFLLAVLMAVSVLRIYIFSGSTISDDELVLHFAIESALLFIDRWVGAEPIMTAVSTPGASIDLLVKVLTENPALGVNSIYQNISGSQYELLSGLTFLSLPGYFGVFSLSGSKAVIFSLSFVMTSVGIFIEKVMFFSLKKQIIPTALASAALANSFTQISFPALVIPFVIQLVAICVIIGLLKMKSHRDMNLVVMHKNELSGMSGTPAMLKD